MCGRCSIRCSLHSHGRLPSCSCSYRSQRTFTAGGPQADRSRPGLHLGRDQPGYPARVDTLQADSVERLYAESEASFADWEIVKDVVDEFIDLALNYRQSGHPGGSRSKVHLLLATMLSGAMHWDIRRPWLPFADRFVLSAGHTAPVVY